MGSGRVLGVDACKRGWIAIAVEDGVTGAYFAEDIQTLTNLAQAHGPLDVVAVDMPIGLPDRGQRQADVLARAAIGPLRSSVFITPVRAALMAADHAAASAINRELTGQGISIQAFGLKPKLVPGRAVGAAHAHPRRGDPSRGLLRPACREPFDVPEVIMGGRRIQAGTACRCGHRTCWQPRQCGCLRRG
jgi:hypothetical protein